jgi:hypothetical protein
LSFGFDTKNFSSQALRKTTDALDKDFPPELRRDHYSSEDIAVAIEYYNALSSDLGYRFADLVADYFDQIAELPTASATETSVANP